MVSGGIAWFISMAFLELLPGGVNLNTGSAHKAPESSQRRTDVDVEIPETILTNHSNSQRAGRAIEDPPLRYRESVVLCEVEDMSCQEIAEILSIPTEPVMPRLARARK
jgi:DNA-directed RNA polymerase specialized sigma24 family protein